MSKRYSISELVDILGVSRTAVNRKIKKYKFEIIQDYVNSRLINLVLLSNEELQALKQEVEQTRSANINELDMSIVKHDHDTAMSHNKINNNEVKTQNYNAGDLIERVLNHSETYMKQLQQYTERLINAESQVKLLETLDQKKEKEYFEIIAKNKELLQKVEQLEKENTQIKKELEKKSKWFRWK